MPESTFRELADNAPVMIWRADADKLCDWFNKPWLDFTGRSMAQELGYGWAECIHPEDFDRCVAIYTNAFDARAKFSMTYRLRRRDGVYRWLLDNGAPYHRDGVFAGYFGTCVDVSEQREEHALLEASLVERDALLREVYHRVKNNLQQMQGLIAIERAEVRNAPAAAALDALSARVRAMGAVHHRLMQAKNIGVVSVRDFIVDLCADISHSHGADVRRIVLDIACEPLEMNIEQAVILGLLVNELVTNALKHGFPQNRAGRITISYGRQAAGAVLEVADDGVGMNASAPTTGQSGFRLIRGFVGQLRGRLVVESNQGTVVRVLLP